MDMSKPYEIPKKDVMTAFKRVKANGGSAGIDEQDINGIGSSTVTVNNVGAALTDINNYVNEGITFSANSGTAYTVVPGNAVSVLGQGTAFTPNGSSTTYTGTNLYATEANGTIDILMSTTPSFTSVTTGNTVMNTSGITTTDSNGNTTAVSPIGIVSSTSSTVLNSSGTTLYTANNVGTALTDINNYVNEGISFKADNVTGKSGGGTAYAATPGSMIDISGDDGNITTSISGSDITVSMSATPSFTSVTTGNTVMNTAGITTTDSNGNTTAVSPIGIVSSTSSTSGSTTTITTTAVSSNGIAISKNVNDETSTTTNGPSMTTGGINAGGNTITHVAAGNVSSTSTDAVNGSQLYAAENVISGGSNTLGTSVAKALGGGSAYESDTETITAPSYEVKDADNKQVGQTANNVGDALTNLNNYVNEGITFAADSGTAYTATPGSTVDIKGDGDTITTSVSGSVIAISISENPKFTSVTASDGKGDTTEMSGNGLSATDGTNITTVNPTGVWIANGPSITTGGINAGGKVISNAAAGSKSTDVVNVSQLDEAEAAATTTVSAGKNITVTHTPAADGHTAYTVSLDDQVVLGDGSDAIALDGKNGMIVAGNTTISGTQIQIGTSVITDDGVITAGTGSTQVKVDGTDGVITAGTEVVIDGLNGTEKIGNITLDGSGTAGTITGLTNTSWDPNHYVPGRAATEGELEEATSGASGGMYFAADEGTSIHKNLGDTLNIVGGYEGSGTTSATNVKTVTTSDGKLQIQLADNASFTTVTTGNTTMSTTGVTAASGSGNSTTSLTGTGVTASDNFGNSTSVSSTGVTATDGKNDSTAVSSTGLTTKDSKGNSTAVTGNGVTITGANGSSVSLTSSGLDNGGNKITNVADGTANTDAVNLGQLKAAVTASATTVSGSKNVTVTAGKAADGHTDYNVALKDAITLGSGTDAVTVDGDSGTIAAGTGSNQVEMNGSNGTITAGSTSSGNAVVMNGTTGTITAGTKVSLNGTTGNAAIGNVTINGSGSTGTITGLTNKAWNPESITSGQAATEDQLKTLDSRSVQYAQNSDGTTNTSAIKLRGTNGTTISNVAAGEVSATSTDAVNGGQLYSVNQSVAEEGSAINTLGHDLSNLSTRVNKVGAGAAALAGLHPLDFNPNDKLDVAAGYGTYKSQNAMSLGVFYHANANTMFSMAASMGNGENMVSAGLTFKIGSGGTGNYNHFLSNGNVTVLQKEIQTLQNQNQVLISDNVQMKKDSEQMKQDNEQIKKDNEEMKKDNEQMKAEIELLKQKMGL